MRNNRVRNESWEDTLVRGLYRFSDLTDEDPPNVAALQMLVARVQWEERRRAVRDLLLFLMSAFAILGALVCTLAASPGLFLASQAVSVIVLLGVAAASRGEWRQAS